MNAFISISEHPFNFLLITFNNIFLVIFELFDESQPYRIFYDCIHKTKYKKVFH